MKKQLILFVLLLCCFSCVSQKKGVIAKSTIKLEGRNTNIRDLIEIDGYYYYQEQDYPGYRMFFEDGTYVSFSFNRDIPENERKTNMSKSVTRWIGNKQVNWGNYWGVYKIEGDTLIAYYYLRGSFWTPWYLNELRYKIIDRTTILPIYSKGLLPSDEQYGRDPWLKNANYFHFTPADSLPSSDNWLKEEKWIWRNEQDWRDYMEKIKQKK